MLREGYFALHRGREYRADLNAPDGIRLFTNHVRKIDESFMIWQKVGTPEMYTKIAYASELDDLYRITPFARISECEKLLQIREEKEDRYYVTSEEAGEECMRRYGLEQTKQGGCGGWLNRDEVCLVEWREDRTGQYRVVRKPKLRMGDYAIYRGRDYAVEYKQPGGLYLYTDNSRKIDESFMIRKEILGPESYEKAVLPSELDGIYEVVSYVLTKEGHRLQVIGERGGEYLLRDSDNHENRIGKSEGRLIEEWTDLSQQYRAFRRRPWWT